MKRIATCLLLCLWATCPWSSGDVGGPLLARDDDELARDDDDQPCPCVERDNWPGANPTWVEFAAGDRQITRCFAEHRVTSVDDLQPGAEELDGAAVVTPAEGAPSCQVIDGDRSESLRISLHQATACTQLLREAAAAQGVSCS